MEAADRAGVDRVLIRRNNQKLIQCSDSFDYKVQIELDNDVKVNLLSVSH